VNKRGREAETMQRQTVRWHNLTVWYTQLT